MPSSTQTRGGRAEQRAVFFLRRQGFRILDRHVTSRFGEIDIIAKRHDTIYIVEVKFRRKSAWPIEWAMSEKKIARMVQTYEQWSGKSATQIRMAWVLLDETSARLLIQ